MKISQVLRKARVLLETDEHAFVCHAVMEVEKRAKWYHRWWPTSWDSNTPAAKYVRDEIYPHHTFYSWYSLKSLLRGSGSRVLNADDLQKLRMVWIDNMVAQLEAEGR